MYQTGSCRIRLAPGAARCQLTLDADFATLTAQFTPDLKAGMAEIMDIQAHRVDIVTVSPGSVVVMFDVYPSNDESDSTPAEAIHLLQSVVAQGLSGAFAGYSAVSLEIITLPDDGEDPSTNLLDREFVLSMEQVLIVGGAVGGVLLLLICTCIMRAICCRKDKGSDKYVTPVSDNLNGSRQNSPPGSPKSPAAIRRQREAERALTDSHMDVDDEMIEEEEDQLSPLETVSSAEQRKYRDPYMDDWPQEAGGGSPSSRREGRARSSSVSSSSGRNRSNSGRSRSGSLSSGSSGRSRSGSLSGGGSSRKYDDSRRSRSGSISSGSHRSTRSGSISGSSSRARSRSISGTSGHRSRSGSVSSSGRERSNSDGRRRSVSSKQSRQPSSADIDPEADMIRAVQEHEAAMAAEAEADSDSPPGSVPHSPGNRSPSYRKSSRGDGHGGSRHDRRKSRSSRSVSRREIHEDSYSSED